MAIRVIVLQPGECTVIPSTATVLAIAADGGNLSSTCDNLPEITGYTCWEFSWEELGDDFSTSYFESLTVGDNTYIVPSAYNPYNNRVSPFVDDLKLGEWIDNDPQFAGLVKRQCESYNSGNVTFRIKIPDGLPAPVLKIVNNTSGTPTDVYLYLIGEKVSGDCETC